MPMIHAETVKAVQELLRDRGIEQHENESWGDYVARGLGVSAGQAEAFLEALHEGCTVEEAVRVTGISAPAGNSAVLKEIARTVGTALGKITRLSKGKRKACVPAAARARFSAVGATEDQVNVILPVPQRLDNRGTKAEDLAGTGTHDSDGG